MSICSAWHHSGVNEWFINSSFVFRVSPSIQINAFDSGGGTKKKRCRGSSKRSIDFQQRMKLAVSLFLGHQKTKNQTNKNKTIVRACQGPVPTFLEGRVRLCSFTCWGTSPPPQPSRLLDLKTNMAELLSTSLWREKYWSHHIDPSKIFKGLPEALQCVLYSSCGQRSTLVTRHELIF